MRVTETRLTELAKSSLDQARQRIAAPQEELQSGLRVARPSQGVADWARGERARARITQSEARGEAIGIATSQLEETDRVFDSIGGILAEAKSLAVQGGNDSLSASDRQNIATLVAGLRQQAVSISNALGPTGDFLLSGSKNSAAFDTTTGAFLGDNSTRTIEIGEGQSQTVSSTGETLTVTSGVDVFATLDALQAALASNNSSAVRALMPSLDRSVEQVGAARATLGGQLTALQDADESRKAFEESLSRVINNAQDSDVIEATSQLAAGLNALEAAKASTEKIFSFLSQR